MDYYIAYIKLYGAIGAALDELKQVYIVPLEIDIAIKTLKNALDEVENMNDKKPDG